MNMNVSIEGDLDVRKLLHELGERATPALRSALFDEGNELLNEADKLVPRDTATLAGSKYIDASSPLAEVIVGYGGAAAPYALAVHENPRSGVTGGVSPSGKKYAHWAVVGQWKYLETPFKERLAGVAARIAASLRASLLKGR